MKKSFAVAFVAMAMALAVSTVAHAATFKVFAAMSYVSPLSESDQNVGGVTEAVKASSEFGYNAGVELRGTGMFGLELDYLHAKEEISAGSLGVVGSTTFEPISATLNIHLPVPMADVYAGPTVSYVNWGDLKIPASPDQPMQTEVAYGLSAGADISVMPMLSVTGGLRWINVKAQPDVSGSESLDVNPLFARVGLAAKF